MKSLVTGGAGFIGTHVVRELLNRGHEVVVLDDLSGGFEENVPEGAQLIAGSILDETLLDDLFARNRFDYVYHFAAYAAEGLSHFIKKFNYTNNVIGSINLINRSIRNEVRCFVFTSSIAVYGRNQLPMSEELTPQPEDPYGIAKFAVELDLAASKEIFGLPYVIFRPHNVYGEYQNIGDRYRNVVGIFMNQIMQDQPLTVFGDGSQSRAFSYVGDIARPIAEAATREDVYGETFNIGADKPYSVREIAEEIGAHFGKRPELCFLPARNEVQHAYSKHDKIRRFFQLEETPLREGLGRMAAWAKKHGPRSSSTFRNIEVSRNLPAIWLE
ncbi:MAG: NAD-dependent epimerase/dehydratase family protein [Chthoniobacterales bacterium]